MNNRDLEYFSYKGEIEMKGCILVAVLLSSTAVFAENDQNAVCDKKNAKGNPVALCSQPAGTNLRKSEQEQLLKDAADAHEREFFERHKQKKLDSKPK